MRFQQIKETPILAAALLLPTVAGVPPGPAAEEPGDARVRKVVVHCEGEDCPAEQHPGHVMILPHGLGDLSHAWLGAHPLAGGGFLGVGLTELTPELRRHFGVPEEAGVMVSRVAEDSAAARAGLQVGDIITAVDGRPSGSSWELARAIRGHEAGESVLLEVWRQGAVESLTATLDGRELLAPRGPMKLVRCGPGEGDCPHPAEIERLCAGSEDCRIEIDCSSGECTCTVNGGSVACDALPSFQRH